MADPGKIALMLELQLAAGPAMKQLELFEEKFAKIEKMAANVGKAMADSGKTAAKAVEAAATASAPVSNTPLPDFEPELAATGYDKLAESIKKYQEILDYLGDDTSKLFDLDFARQRQVISLARSYGKLTDSEKQNLEVTEKTKETLGNLSQYAGPVNNALAIKEESVQMWNKLSGGIGHVNNAFDRLFAGYSGYVVLLGLVNELIGITIDEQNEFAKANYRASGSVDGLQTSMRALQGATAASAEDAMKAGKAVFFAGIRAAEGQALIMKKTVQLAAAYGVSETAAASYAARIMMMGGNANDAAASMEYTAKAVSKAGLSAQEAEQLFTDLSEKMWDIYALTGSKEAADNFSRAFSTLTALARDAKLPLKEIQDTVTSIAEGSLDLVRSGIDANELFYGTDNLKATAELMDVIPGRLEAIDKAPKFMRNTMSEAMVGIPLKQARSLDILRKKLDTLGITGATTEEKLKKYQEQIEEQQSIDESYQDTLNTLTGVLKQALIPVLNLLSAVLVPVGRAVVFLMKPLMFIGEAIGKLYSWAVGLVGVDIATWITGGAVAIALLFTKLRPLMMMGGKLALLSTALTLLGSVMEKWPGWLQAIGYTAGLAATGFVLFYGGFGKMFSGIKLFKNFGGGFKGMFDFFKKWKTEGPGAKGGMEVPDVDPKKTKNFFQSLADGLKEFASGSGKIIKGAATFAVVMVLLLAPIVLMAWIVKKLEISAGDMGIALMALAGVLATVAVIVPLISAFSAAGPAFIKGALFVGIGIAILGAAVGVAVGLAIGLVKALSGIGEGIGKAAVGIGEGIADVAKGLGGGLKTALEGVGEALSTGAKALADGFADMLGQSAADKMRDMGDAMGHWADAFARAPNLANDIQTITNAFVILQTVSLDGGIALTMLAGVFASMINAIDPSRARDAASAINEMAGAVDKIAAASANTNVDLYQLLAGNIVDNESSFKRAAAIINDYADTIAEDLEKVHGLADLVKQAQSLQQANAALEPTTPVTTLASSKAVTAKLDPIIASNDEHAKILQEQLKALEKLNANDKSKSTNDLLVEIRNRLDELIDSGSRGAMVNSASLWQA